MDDHTKSAEFVMEHGTISVTQVCSLNCRLCAAYVPYYRRTAHFPLADNVKMLAKYFDIVDYVKKFTISGGEPLVYPYIAEFVERLLEYEAQIGVLEIISNGSIIPSADLLDALHMWGDKVVLMIDHYDAVSKQRVADVEMTLAKAGVRYVSRNYTSNDPHCGGWVNFGNLSERKARLEKDIKQKYQKCAYPGKIRFCFTMMNGKMYPCSPARICNELGISNNDNDYIDLLDETLSVEEQRNKIRTILDGTQLDACAYCNGLCEDSERFVPAEQLSVDEMKIIHSFPGDFCPPWSLQQLEGVTNE